MTGRSGDHSAQYPLVLTTLPCREPCSSGGLGAAGGGEQLCLWLSPPRWTRVFGLDSCRRFFSVGVGVFAMAHAVDAGFLNLSRYAQAGDALHDVGDDE